jgi:aerobic carbon-monoxide dehydrogenase large subunit
MSTSAPKLVGTSVRRNNSRDPLTGKATYASDIRFPETKYAAIFRSPHAHARIRKVDLSRALSVPGIVAALSGSDLPAYVKPIPMPPAIERQGLRVRRPAPTCLAIDKVRFVGEPLAVVVATDPYIAEDALELIDADFDLLPAVVDADKAMERSSPLIYENWGDNIMLQYSVSGGDVERAFGEADVVFEDTIHCSRFTGTPIEPRAVVARYHSPENLLELWDTAQRAHNTSEMLQRVLALPGLKVRVIIPRLGGAFGNKEGGEMEEVIVSLMAYITKSPIKWVATRSEYTVVCPHAREQTHHLNVAVKKDGTVLGLKDRIVANMGSGYNLSGVSAVQVTALYVPGVYRIKNYEAEVFGVATNKTSFGAHRGFGKAEAGYVIERLMDIIAEKLRLDPIEIRRKNFIRPEEFPYLSVTGSRYDSGNYGKTLDKALELVNYSRWREEQERARKQGRWIGIGTAIVLEPTGSHRGGPGSYYAVRIRMDLSGNVWVFLSGNDDGTGHSTAIAQIVADELGIAFENVNTVEGDSLLCPYGDGSHSSRFGALGASAVMLAAKELKKKIQTIAAGLLEVEPKALAIEGGTVVVASEPSVKLTLQEVARVAYSTVHQLPPGVEPGLEILYYYRAPNLHPRVDERGREQRYAAYSYGVDVAVVEVDVETCKIKILKYVSVHDCGNMINPKEVVGQQLGALAHGIGGALYEEFIYDENGQPLVQNFKDYLVPTAVEIPRFELGHTTSPAPFAPGGFKGAGETGTVSPPPCLANAVADALRPKGVEIRTLPLKPDLIYELLRRVGDANNAT